MKLKQRELINKRCFGQFQASAYIVKTKSQISEWVEDFEKIRKQILISRDSKKYNYAFNRFDLQKQEEVTVVYWKGQLVAFSSLYNSGYYPKDLSRVLNRMWKAPRIRFLTQHYMIHFIMLSIQLNKALSLQKKAVFISIEGRKNWLNMFTSYLKEKDERWVCYKGQYKVAPGNDESCWQNVAFLPLIQKYKLHFPYRE